MAEGTSKFFWTDAFESGRGKGKGKALNVYPHAKKLDVRDLASSLVSSDGKINDGVWNQLIASGEISEIRTRKNGSPISFQYGGKRIRFSTLKGFIQLQKQNKGVSNMATEAINMKEKLPLKLEDELSEAGFSSKDIAAINQNLRAIHDYQKRLNKVAEINPSTPEI